VGRPQHPLRRHDHDACMNRYITTPLIVLTAALSICTLTSCGVIADHISEEATEELAFDVQARISSAASASGRPTNDFGIIEEALRRVVLVEAVKENGSFRPSFTGLLDADADGLDDDGQVEILVRQDTSCVRANGHDVVVISGSCT
jgi:hypothetical protein